jgi:hypothetical protein
LGKTSPININAGDAALWKTYAINQLILHKHLLEKESLLTSFREFFSRTAELNGCARNVERTLGLSDSLIVRWRKRNRPKFSQLLDVSEKLGIFPHEILLGNARVIDLQSTENSYKCSSISKKRAPVSLLDLDRQLTNLLESTPGISLKKLSTCLNVSEGFIRYRYPDLADELSNQSSERNKTGYAERHRELYESAIKILCIAYQANKSIGIHQLRELLRDYPGFGHLSMPAIREFILNNSLNDETRNNKELFSTCNHEKLLLHSQQRRFLS